MRVGLDMTKSVDENAQVYYEKSKKAKKKLAGAQRTLETMKLKEFEAKQKQKELKPRERKVVRKKEWYEKFRWFMSSDGFLCIGGRDAVSNEIVVKKHAEQGDWVLHTDMRGSPFVIIKADSQEVPLSTIEEAGVFVASHSRAWKKDMSTIDVFYVRPDQVSKKAEGGVSLPRGAFFISGETKYVYPRVELAVGAYEDKIMVGPVSAVKTMCGEKILKIIHGDMKTSDAAKKVRSLLGGELDDIIAALPSGGIKFVN